MWLWLSSHLTCMDEMFGDVDGTEWTRWTVTRKIVMSVR